MEPFDLGPYGFTLTRGDAKELMEDLAAWLQDTDPARGRSFEELIPGQFYKNIATGLIYQRTASAMLSQDHYAVIFPPAGDIFIPADNPYVAHQLPATEPRRPRPSDFKHLDLSLWAGGDGDWESREYFLTDRSEGMYWCHDANAWTVGGPSDDVDTLALRSLLTLPESHVTGPIDEARAYIAWLDSQ